MARVRLQPFLTASAECVEWAGWKQETDSGLIPLGTMLEGWDYNQSIRLVTSPEVNLVKFASTTQIEDLESVDLVATADCTHTGTRFMTRATLLDYSANLDRQLVLEIPAGQVANSLQLRCHLILSREISPSGVAAHRKGSRLAESPLTRLVLEGDGSRFPTEAVSFADLRWENAAWSVRIDIDDFDEAFAGGVRLLMNVDHPIGHAMARMDKRTFEMLGPVLKADIIRSLLHEACELLNDQGNVPMSEDMESMGGVVELICDQHFGMGLPAVAELRRTDFARYERILQASVGLEALTR